jgi:hypothetical protein
VGSPYGLSLMSSLGQGKKKEGGDVREGGEGEGEGGGRDCHKQRDRGGEGQWGSWLCPLSLRVYIPHHKYVRTIANNAYDGLNKKICNRKTVAWQ